MHICKTCGKDCFILGPNGSCYACNHPDFNPLEPYTVKELIEELKKREGVQVYGHATPGITIYVYEE